MGYNARHTNPTADKELHLLTSELKHGTSSKGMLSAAIAYGEKAKSPVALVDLIMRTVKLEAADIDLKLVEDPLKQMEIIYEFLVKRKQTVDLIYVEFMCKIFLEIVATLGPSLLHNDCQFEALARMISGVESVHLRLLKERTAVTLKSHAHLRFMSNGEPVNLQVYEYTMAMSLSDPTSNFENAKYLTRFPETTDQMPIDRLFSGEASLRSAVVSGNTSKLRIYGIKTEKEYLCTLSNMLKSGNHDDLGRLLGLLFRHDINIISQYRYFAAVTRKDLFLSILKAFGFTKGELYKVMGEKMSTLGLKATWNMLQWADNLKDSPFTALPIFLYDNVFKGRPAMLTFRFLAHLVSCELASCVVRIGIARDAINLGIPYPHIPKVDSKSLVNSMNVMADFGKAGSLHTRLVTGDLLSNTIDLYDLGNRIAEEYPIPAIKKEVSEFPTDDPLSQHFITSSFILAHCRLIFADLVKVQSKMRSLMVSHVAIGNRYGASMKLAEQLTLNFY